MKKKFRKVVAVISATVMVLAMGVVSVNASDIQPRAMLCPNCGSAMTNVREVFQTRVIEVKCTHGYLHGMDSLTQRKYQDTPTCPTCHLRGNPSYTGFITVSTKCGGYN